MLIDAAWRQELDNLVQTILSKTPIQINSQLSPKIIPSKKGIYVFSDITDNECIYVGQSTNVYQRVCRVHILGKDGDSSFRDALLGLKVTRGNAVTTGSEINKYMQDNFVVRFYLEEDDNRRGLIESYLIALLKPRYSIPIVKKR